MSDEMPHLDKHELRVHEWRNRLQTLLLVVGLLVIASVIGWTIAGKTGLILLAAGALFFLFVGQKAGPKLTLRAFKARPVRDEEAPEITAVIRTLAERAKLPVTPTLYYIPSEMANAFATGSKRNPVIAITDGILRTLTMRELTGVLAHEMSHLRNNDLAVMGLADLASRTSHMASRIGQLLLILNLPMVLFGGGEGIPWLLVIVLIAAPSLTALMQMALSRTREYDADADAARLTGDPEGLALALQKLEKVHGGLMERIFMPGRRVPEPSILRTHPPTEERVKRLYAYAGKDYEPPPEDRRPVRDVYRRMPPPPPRRPHWHFFSGVWS